MELIFHKSEKYIDEDIFYYISDQRDKHSMIKPKKENLISMTVESDYLKFPNKDEVNNAFYPFEKNSIDKIYIGLSFPLFSNNWASSYLRYLLKIIKKDGAIILPVYPEEQASEKGMWSRSFLENIFTSRTGWTGTNNVWAENDGVMSMRIGKTFPKKINSTLNYYLEESGNQSYRTQLSDNNNTDNLKLIKNIWAISRVSQIIEKIIQDAFENKKIIYCDVGTSPSLPFEVSVSNYINIKKTIISTENSQSYENLNNYFSYRVDSEYIKLNDRDIVSVGNLNPDVISIIYNKDNVSILEEVIKCSPNSIVIVYDDLDISNDSYKNYSIEMYSSIVATRLDEGKIINHYSDAIEKEINQESGANSSKIYVLKPN